MQKLGLLEPALLACQRVLVRGLRVWNHVACNADGIDVDGCRDVVVAQCFFDSDDDALCLKSTGGPRL